MRRAFAVFSLLLASATWDQVLPPGWTSYPANAEITHRFRPVDLGTGEECWIQYYAMTGMAGLDIATRAREAIAADAPPPGAA